MEQQSRNKRIVDMVCGRRDLAIPDIILDDIKTAPSIVAELYTKTVIDWDSVDIGADQVLSALKTLIVNGNVTVVEHNHNGIIRRRHEGTQSAVTSYCILYGAEARMLLVVNNYMLVRGYDKKYLQSTLVPEIIVAVNENLVLNKDHIS